jgi:predicted dehydrogenase
VTEQRFSVGIVGLEPGRGWAARAHVPALRALSDSYEIVGVANTSLASAKGRRPRSDFCEPSLMLLNWYRLA